MGKAGHDVPVVADPLRDVDEHEGDVGQLGAEVLEDLLELRHDLQHDEDEDADGEEHDEDRVDHRSADLALQRLGPLLELGEPLQDDFQGPARLAGLDHVDVQAVEGLGATWPWPRRGWSRSRSRRRRRSASSSWRRAWTACSRIFRLRRIGRPASWRMANWRVKVVRVLGLTPPRAKVLPFLAAVFFGLALAGPLHGDLGDEQAPLADCSLGLVLVWRPRRSSRIFLSGRVHRLKLKSRHGTASPG